MKAICLIRTSTDRQRIEEQRAEVLQMAYADGYTDEDIEIIGKCGASAIKLDDAYMENLNLLYDRIKSGDVAVVYAWAIDRIGRDEVVLMQLKNTLIRHKIQLVIKNPSLTLLNSDGSVNSGVEIAFSLFATMAKQEMEQKKKRFHRGKKQNAEAGKFNGGTVPYGYDVDERGFYTLHPTDADNVRLAFELMATDKFTVATLTNELRSRGVMFNGRLITYQFVASMLTNTAYKGLRNKYAFDKVYPRIVSDELFQAVQRVKADNNSTKGKATKHYNLAALLIKCPDCGRSYISHGGKYVCSGHNSPSIRVVMGQNKCSNNIIIRQRHLDGVLWAIAQQLHSEKSEWSFADLKEETYRKIDVIKVKMDAADERKKEIAERYERIEDVYMSGRMTKERYNRQIANVKADEDQLNNEMEQYAWEIRRLSHILFSGETPQAEDISGADEKKRYEIVHDFIIGVALDRYTTEEGRKGVKVSVSTYDNKTISLIYLPSLKGTDRKMFTRNEDGKLVPFDYEPIDK